MSRTNRNMTLFLLMAVLLVACGTSAPVEEPVNEAPAVVETVVEEAEEPTAEEAEAPAAEKVAEEPAEAEGPARGGAVVRAMTSEPAQIDPQGTPTSGLALVLPYLFDTLVVRDVDNSVHPLLAESWQVSEDGLEITFQLKEGVTFHDGTPLNAAAVQLTFERFKEVGTSSPIYGGVMQIARIEAVSDLTVRFSFEAPAANIWSTLSMPYAGIISPESVRLLEEAGEGHVSGSGPFMLESWDAGQSITLASNPDYAWGSPIMDNQGQPFLDALIYKVIPDPAIQLAAFQSGEVNVFWINQPSHRLVLEADDTVRMVDAHTNGLVYLGFNCQKAPFDQVLVRQALSHAVNKAEILELAAGGIGELATAPLPSTLPGYDPSLDQHEFGFDPQKAQELLLEAGFAKTADGGWEWEGEALSLQLLTTTRAPNGDIATLVQSQFQAIGVPVEIQQLDSRAVAQATTEGAFDLLIYRYGWNDPDALSIFLSSARIGRTNRVAYGNADVDALLEQGAHELDEAARIATYVDAQEIIMQEAPWQPLYYTMDVIAINDQVQGARVGHMGRLLLNDAYIVAD